MATDHGVSRSMTGGPTDGSVRDRSTETEAYVTEVGHLLKVVLSCVIDACCFRCTLPILQFSSDLRDHLVLWFQRREIAQSPSLVVYMDPHLSKTSLGSAIYSEATVY